LPWLARGQDIHFSQSEFSPLFVNPAYTGRFQGDFRLVNNYRSQWRSINKAFSTLGLGMDKPVTYMGEDFGVGFVYFNDYAGNKHLVTHSFHASLAYQMNWNNHQITAGLQPGFVLREFDSETITFPSQYDPSSGGYNTGIPNGESMLEEQIHYFDLNAGIAWRKKINHLLPAAGFAVDHLNRPVESFNKNDNWPRKAVKYTVTGSIAIELENNFTVKPSVFYSQQQSATEFMVGGMGFKELKTEEFKKVLVFAGPYFRSNLVKNFDAMIITGGIQINNIGLAINYDVNVSGLRQASNFKGAFEFSIVYIHDKSKTVNIKEPCLIY
jgi:type IX secretion system PorP/SprF family membrane protein